MTFDQKQETFYNEWEIKRCDRHAPIGVESVYQQNQESLLRWSADIGEPVYRMSKAIFSRQGIDGMQSVRALCHIAKQYGRVRLNQACSRTLEFKAMRYRDVKQMLITAQEQLSSASPN